MENEQNNLANDTNTSDGAGFQISARPLVPVQRAAEPVAEEKLSPLSELTKSYGGNLFYVMARDPRTLFAYWDLDWRRIFAEAQLASRAVFLRVSREDFSPELVVEIDPCAGQHFAPVNAPGASYLCELGCFDAAQWKTLLRAEPITMMTAKETDDFEPEFATLPLHLSFQRLLDLFRTNEQSDRALAQVIGKAQAETRVLRAQGCEVQPSDLGMSGLDDAEFAALFPSDAESPSAADLSRETMERWKQFAQRFNASSSRGSSLPDELA